MAHIHGLSGSWAQSRVPKVYFCLACLLEYLVGLSVMVLPLVIVLLKECWRGVNGFPVE